MLSLWYIYSLSLCSSFPFEYKQTDELTDIHLLYSFFCSITKVLASGFYWCLGKSSLNMQYNCIARVWTLLLLLFLYCKYLLICRLNRNLFLSYHWSAFTNNIIYINYCFFTEIACTRLLLFNVWKYVFLWYFLCSEELSHMLYAAADIVLVPSMYEPCGLAQMIGMRYGAVCTIKRLYSAIKFVVIIQSNNI